MKIRQVNARHNYIYIDSVEIKYLFSISLLQVASAVIIRYKENINSAEFILWN